MPTHSYYVALEKELFAQLRGIRERAKAHKMTIRTLGKDTQPKTFTLNEQAVDEGIVRIKQILSE